MTFVFAGKTSPAAGHPDSGGKYQSTSRMCSGYGSLIIGSLYGCCALIQKLYRIERQAKEEKLDRSALLELREAEARPVMKDLGEMLNLFVAMRPPKTPFGGAMKYAVGQWSAMMRYLEVPDAELDNNSIEHALRSVVMGRRNWLHVGQESGGERAANLFTLMGTCRRLGVEPYEYLCDIVPRMSRHPQKDIWDLTPRGWRDARAKAAGAVAPPA